MIASFSERLKQKLDALPAKPGVYLFKDKKGQVIYIGKALVLRNRVRSYFQDPQDRDLKTRRLINCIDDLEIILTDSEVEALILEANLVREYRPRYNINLKDDKSFPYIRITREAFPRIFPTRRVIRDGSRYFGPYTDVRIMRELLRTVHRLFRVRTCALALTPDSIAGKKHKICLDYHIQRCTGPCEGHISQQEYQQTIDDVAAFIAGRSRLVAEELQRRMQAAAADLRFEEAARLRDQLNSLAIFQQRQKVVDSALVDRDLIAFAAEADDACCVVFKVREGKIIGRQHFYLNHVQDEPVPAIGAAFIQQYYLNEGDIPAEIMLPVSLGEGMEALQEWLSHKRGSPVLCLAPVRGEKAQLLRMCEKNARLLLLEYRIEKEKAADFIAASVQALQKDLHLTVPPKRIECFDISNIQGTDPVASMVCFINGKPQRSEYRRFRIRSQQTPDDFAMMREAVGRRYRRLKAENKPMPELILIDGGKGQLHAALEALQLAGISDQPVIALAKRLDEVFKPGLADAQNIPKGSGALHLLQRARDEAHRFAVTYHRKLRRRRTLHSELQAIQGLGPARRDVLLRHFGSLKRIKAATLEQLKAVRCIPVPLAEKIYHGFHTEGK
ncbi:excinuclease ABC subunit C [bacterium]|nr:excinuclease ABC subunit C [bacterium]